VPTEGRLGTLEITPAEGAHLARPNRLELARGAQRIAVDLPAGAGNGPVVVDPGPLADATGPLTVTIVGSDGATTVDRRYGEVVALPSGLAEVSGRGLSAAPLPDRLDTGCRQDLLDVDENPVGLRVSGPTTDVLAGAALTTRRCGRGADERLDLRAGEHLVESAPGSSTGADI